jgi:predicted nuclease of predicted toxin-antitoxin system
MRVLLDECLPRRLKAHLVGYQVLTVPEAGWSGKKNGELLRAASGLVDVFITVDSNLAYQQHLVGLPFAVVVLSAHSNRYKISSRSCRKSCRLLRLRGPDSLGGSVANSGLNPTGARAEGFTCAAMCPAGMAAAVLR